MRQSCVGPSMRVRASPDASTPKRVATPRELAAFGRWTRCGSRGHPVRIEAIGVLFRLGSAPWRRKESAEIRASARRSAVHGRRLRIGGVDGSCRTD
jgi:hypothetical protein